MFSTVSTGAPSRAVVPPRRLVHPSNAYPVIISCFKLFVVSTVPEDADTSHIYWPASSPIVLPVLLEDGFRYQPVI